MSTARFTDAEVLVVGAGPTGLTLACDLRRRGIACRLVEAASAPATTARATGLHARSLEIFDDLGVVDEFLAQGARMTAVASYLRPWRELARLEYAGIESPYPFVLGISQALTEAILTRRLEQLGGQVERGIAFQSLEQNQEQVWATLEDARLGTEVCRTPFLIGCDGAHSAVRHALEVPFEGTTYPEYYLVADVRLGGELPEEVMVFYSPPGSLMIGRHGAGRHLLLASMGKATGPLPQAPGLSEVQALLDARGPGELRLEDAEWVSYFRVHSRQAARYRVGRVFLAGDACHVQSPFAGKGMNVGIQDAYNLGWKLQFPHLLDSYEAERRQAGREMLDYTDRAHRNQMDIQYAPGRTQAIRSRLANPFAEREARHDLLQAMAEISCHYRHSPIVGGAGVPGGPWPGDRAPSLHELLRGPEHHLLAFGVRPPKTFATPHKLPPQEPWGQGLYLVRPDAHIGYAGDAAGLKAYLKRVYAPRLS